MEERRKYLQNTQRKKRGLRKCNGGKMYGL